MLLIKQLVFLDMASDPERAACDAMGRSLVGSGSVVRSRVAAHRECAGRDLAPDDAPAPARVQFGITGRTMWDGWSASA